MTHLMINVTEFEIMAPYTLRIVFDDDTSQIINFEPLLWGPLYAPLRDLKLFNQLPIDPDFQTVVWPNDADFDPATLYRWHDGRWSRVGCKFGTLAAILSYHPLRRGVPLVLASYI